MRLAGVASLQLPAGRQFAGDLCFIPFGLGLDPFGRVIQPRVTAADVVIIVDGAVFLMHFEVGQAGVETPIEELSLQAKFVVLAFIGLKRFIGAIAVIILRQIEV